MSTPKISVIIPIYNVEKYLDKCLLSVRNQTLEDIEIICVDDCSPDDSYKIVEKHIKQDKRIRLIRHKKNLGLGGARNTAIRAAKAEYLASVDSDDYISSTMLEMLWNSTENGWFDIVCCGYNRVDEEGNVISSIRPAEKQVFNDDNNIDIFTLLPPAFWNKLWRKSLFVDNDIFFPNHDFYEDMSTTPRILSKARYIKIIKDNLYQYLIRDESIMNSFSDKHIIDYLKGFEIIAEFLEKNNLKECYEEEFNNYIKGNILYYAKTILGANVLIDKKKQYLRFLVLFRVTFCENYSYFKWHDIDGLIMLLREENLQGAYSNKYRNTLSKIEIKEDYIRRQSIDIDGKKKLIHNYSEIINLLRDEKNSNQKDLKSLQSELTKTQTDLTKTKIDLSNMNSHLNVINENLLQTRGNLLVSEDRVKLLKDEAAEKISFPQIFAVSFFAILTVAVMSKSQTLKLINKPKIFFRDSKSGFAKKYASWFNIT